MTAPTTTAGPAGDLPAPRRHARVAASSLWTDLASAALRCLPAVLTVLVVVLVLRRFGTPVPVSAAYVAYLLVLVTVPGTVAWRAARRDRGLSFTEDVAVGTALGLATHVLLAFALAPVRLASWAWVWAPLVIALSLLVRRWRSAAWSRPGPSTTGLASASVQGLTVVGATVWLAATAFASNPVQWVDGSGPWSRAVPVAPYIDLPFHHAIAAGVDTHFPLVYPYLYDEPLHYHLFSYLHLAGAAHTSGIDLTWLLFRLVPAAMVALGVVLAGVLARRLSGVGWSAPLAAAIVTFSSAANVYGWLPFPFQNPGFLHFATFRSPTQTFGLPLFLATVVVAVVLLRGGTLRGRLPLLAVFAALAWGSGGSKSTFLPVVIAALALVVVVALVLRARVVALAATLLGICVAGFGLLLVVVLGGQSGSLTVAPDITIRAFAAVQTVADPTSTRDLVLLTALALVAWLCTAAGVVLLLRRDVLRDTAFWLVLGVAGAGIGACLLTAANGLSQLYFLYASWPALGVLSAWGVARATRGWSRRSLVVVPAALLAGVVAIAVVRRVDGIDRPAVDPGFPFRAVLGPWALLLAAAVLVGVVAALVARRRGTRWGATPVTAALVAGTLVVVGAATFQRGTETLRGAVAVVRDGQGPGEGVPLPMDGARAALWVRDHSGQDDVVATNAHCYGPVDSCDARHFWVSALAERRVLLEGWAYPEGFRPGQTRTSPFWDADRYDANEAVFDDPDEASVQRLADEWGVRWLLVDRSLGTESPRLREHATLVYENDGAAVYRVDRP